MGYTESVISLTIEETTWVAQQVASLSLAYGGRWELVPFSTRKRYRAQYCYRAQLLRDSVVFDEVVIDPLDTDLVNRVERKRRFRDDREIEIDSELAALVPADVMEGLIVHYDPLDNKDDERAPYNQ
jgi:hypothetical protein